MRAVLIAIVLFVAAPRVAGQSHAVADSLLALHDTTGAIAALEQMARRNRRDAEAHWRAGVLLMTRHVPGSELSPNRRRAEEHFRYATRFEPDSAKYALALAELLRGENWMPSWLQLRGLERDALAAAERVGDSAQVVASSYELGRDFFRSAGNYTHRMRTVINVSGFDPVEFHYDWDYVEQFIASGGAVIPDAGEGDLRQAEQHLRRAVQLDPGHVDAAGMLIVTLGEQDRWEEAREVAHHLVQARPAGGRAWALAGLTFARLDRWEDAQAAFDTAMRHMSPGERAPFDDLRSLLRTADQIRWDQMGPAERVRTVGLYWDLAQPLLLTPRNEVRSEYYARVVYASIRWSDPERGREGARTDQGMVYIRFGPPDVIAAPSRSQVAWIYRPARLRFLFSGQDGYARLYEQSRTAFDDHQRAFPGRFDNVPAARTLDTIVTQVAQFRGERGRTDVAVFGWVPVGRMVEGVDLASLSFESAAILRNDGGEVQRMRREETLDPRSAAASQHRTWRMTLPDGEFFFRIEAHAPVLDRGARHSEILRIRPYHRPEFQLSDVLVARRLAPRDSAPGRWTDFFIEPSAGRAEPREVVSLLWENYNLTPGPDGIARWHVELRVTVTRIERGRWLARIVGGIGDAVGTSALGDERISLGWDRDAAVAPGAAIVDWVTLDFGSAPAGTYTISLEVTDRVGGTTIARTRTIVRSEREARR